MLTRLRRPCRESTSSKVQGAIPYPVCSTKIRGDEPGDREFAAEMISSGARKMSDVTVLISDQLTEENSVEDLLYYSVPYQFGIFLSPPFLSLLVRLA